MLKATLLKMKALLQRDFWRSYIRIFSKGCEQAVDETSLINFLESLQRCPDLKNLLVGVLVAHHA